MNLVFPWRNHTGFKILAKRLSAPPLQKELSSDAWPVPPALTRPFYGLAGNPPAAVSEPVEDHFPQPCRHVAPESSPLPSAWSLPKGVRRLVDDTPLSTDLGQASSGSYNLFFFPPPDFASLLRFHWLEPHLHSFHNAPSPPLRNSCDRAFFINAYEGRVPSTSG